MTFVWMALGVGATACGARTGLGVEVFATDDGGLKDAATTRHDAATTVPEAGPDATSVACVAGNYFVRVIDEAGTHLLSAGCADSGVPLAYIGSCGEDCFNVVIQACGGGSIRMTTTAGPPGFPPGSSGADIRYAQGDGGALPYQGLVNINAWPGSGGIVPGSYTGTLASNTQTGSISGTFCVQER